MLLEHWVGHQKGEIPVWSGTGSLKVKFPTSDLSVSALIPETTLKIKKIKRLYRIGYYHIIIFFYLWINGESFCRFSNTEKIKYYFFHCKIQTFLEKNNNQEILITFYDYVLGIMLRIMPIMATTQVCAYKNFINLDGQKKNTYELRWKNMI